jgi:arabinogalactan oligomer / maltooligosaccharide transport system permease protein
MAHASIAGSASTSRATTSRIRTRRRLRPDQRRTVTISWVTLLFVTLLTLFPIFWIVVTSLNVGSSFATGFLPDKYTFEHYADVIQHTDFLVWVRNTLIVGVITAVLEVAVIVLIAYSFSRFRFKGRRWGLVLLVAMQLFPAVMALAADYYLVNWISENWIPISDNWIGLIVIYVGGSIPFNAWLFKGYIDTLPRDLEESAYIDGAGHFAAFWNVILPLCRPMMAFIFIQGFLACANEFLLVSVLVTDASRKTFSMGLFDFAMGNFTTNWTNFAAAAVMGSIPWVAIFLFAQRWFVSGLAGGAVKG